jgi:toxin-antitoxin system PIN domain toxin
MKQCLVDVNVWLALLQADHDHHQKARRWFGRLQSGESQMCRLTQLSLLRLLTNRAVMKSDVLSNSSAWDVVAGLLSDERVGFAPEPAGIDEHLSAYVSLGVPANQVVSDAYLAAFAFAMSCPLVTFDRGMRNFARLQVHLLG